jgi:hypothetical protein
MSDAAAELTCDEVRDELPELALGTLSGRTRSVVLDHVAGCADCRAELRQLSAVADELLQLAPQVEPPVGFELRVAERLGVGADRRRPGGRRVALLCAAAAAFVVFGAGLGIAVSHRTVGTDGRSATAAPISAQLTAQGHTVGQVWVSTGQPAWMFVTIDGMSSAGTVRCVLTLASGSVQTAGVFHVGGDYGAWGVPLRVAPRDVRSVQIVDGNGAVLAGAALSG